MKKLIKSLTIISVAMLSVFLLVACSNNATTDTSTYNTTYSVDPKSLDYIEDGTGETNQITSNAIDGLLENDQYGNLIGSLAKDWTVSSDGLTYTYKLRDDAYWYTVDGEQYAPVTAKDFVTGLKHAADSKASALYLVQYSIAGLDDYITNGGDFSKVGVKAIDDHTVQYTLTGAENYWNSKTTYSILFPVNEDFLTEQGDKFGNATDPSSLLYNGPYIISSLTSKSSITLTKNEHYWDADNVHIQNVNFTYNDGSDSNAVYNGFENGQYTGVALLPTASHYDDAVKKYKDNIYSNPQGSVTNGAVFNIDRTAYTTSAKTTDAQKTSTKAAIQNKDFRQAISFAFDRMSYAAQFNGKKGAANILRSALVPPTFVTVDGEDFGSVVESNLSSYGDEWTDVSLDDGQDSLYNTDRAVTEFNKAKKSLETQGVTFPIHLDVNVNSTSEEILAQAKSFKQSVEASLGKENVVIDLHEMSFDDFYNSDYYFENGSQADFDLSFNFAWKPDYEDPYSYLQIFDVSDSQAYATKYLGLEAGSTSSAISTVGLDTYSSLVKTANDIKDDTTAREQAFAKAQAWLTDSALFIPTLSDGGSDVVTYLKPYTAAYSWVGTKGGAYTYKYRQIQEDLVTTKEYKKARETWLKEKEKSNADYQKDLADHIAD
ncbi:peptide ABC transporter substrate-binding protein [Streptococcus dentiloxodontae]